MNDFDAALAAFVAKLQASFDRHYAGNRAGFTAKVETMVGARYVRVCKSEYAQGRRITRSAYCFVEMSTGNILKPDGWKGPAKNFARGNIRDTDLSPWCTPYGVSSAR